MRTSLRPLLQWTFAEVLTNYATALVERVWTTDGTDDANGLHGEDSEFVSSVPSVVQHIP